MPNEASSSSSSDLDSEGDEQKVFATKKQKQKAIKKIKQKKAVKPAVLKHTTKKSALLSAVHHRKRPIVDLARLYDPSFYS